MSYFVIRFFVLMKLRLFFVMVCGLLWGISLPAQTIIELKKGGRVRSKTADDYRLDNPLSVRGNKEHSEAADTAYFSRWVNAGIEALGRDSFERARTCFTEALRLQPKNQLAPQLHYYVGLLCENRGEATEALRHYDAALELPTGGAELDAVRLRRANVYFSLNRLQEAQRACDELIDRHAQDTALLFLRASVAVAARRYTDARRDLEHLLTLAPTHVSALVCLAHVNQLDGRPRQAMEQLNRAVELAPTDADVLMARAAAARERGLYGLARADLDVALQAHPDRADLYVQRAELHLARKERRAALTDLDKAVSLGYSRSALTPLYQAAQ